MRFIRLRFTDVKQTNKGWYLWWWWYASPVY